MKTENCCSGLTISIGIGVYSKPSASVGTTNRQGLQPLPVLSASSVRATTSTLAASSTPEM